ncbi:SEC14-like protein 4 [Folsomia candida]|uniref:CRAL-TRIO domain-containing protein n=1 Tax=Folsomia candida TaxID=158441 RepID=A0A226E7N8_FOLCA|nr:SEC14-like protein 4 [Folsomia candida]OXA53320.1 hypothetical protein Fcan01_12395 [Folsomia candida]
MHFCQEIYFVLLLFYVNKTLSVTIEQDLSITWDQKQALDKFRELVDSDLTHDYMREDIYLIRWLRARNFDLHAAESMLLKNLDWRKKNGMDSILDEDFSDMESDYKYFIDGFDYQGRPVAFWDLGSYDFRRASLSGKGKRLLRYMDRYLEQVTTKVRTLRETEGRNITQYSLVTNLGGFNVAQHLCLQCLPMTLNFIDSYENHFPGACDSMFLINTPAAMEPVLQVLKNAVSPLTRDSLKIFGRNKEKWQSQVYREIPRNQLPPSVGGTASYAD